MKAGTSSSVRKKGPLVGRGHATDIGDEMIATTGCPTDDTPKVCDDDDDLLSDASLLARFGPEGPGVRYDYLALYSGRLIRRCGDTGDSISSTSSHPQPYCLFRDGVETMHKGKKGCRQRPQT